MNYLFEVRDKSTKRKIKIYGSAFHPILGPVFIIFKENQFLFSEVNNYTPAKENKMFDNENIYETILSKKAEKILKDISKYQKSTYTEVVEKLILAEGRLIDHCLKDMEKKQYKTDSTNTFIAEDHLNKIKRNDD